jgi:CYTH domain-containing protein
LAGRFDRRTTFDIATVAIKGPRIGIAQVEFEYEIPIADAEKMLSTIMSIQYLGHATDCVETEENGEYVGCVDT